MKNQLNLTTIVISTLLSSTLVHAQEKGGSFPPYHAISEIPIQGQGGWDYLSINPDSHHLFVSHSDRISVVDTEKNKLVKEIPDTPGVHGIALALDLKKAFSSNGKEGKVSVIDLNTLTTKGKITVGENPDAIVYEPIMQEVYVFNGRSKTVSVIDAKTERVIATIRLSGKPEFAVVDPKNHRIFVNIEDRNAITTLDTQNHSVVATWPLEHCDSPTGMAIDIENHRLFSVCENQQMVMVDSIKGRTVASVPIGKGADGVVFDSTLQIVFSSNGGSGTVTLVREQTPEKLVVLQNLRTHEGARTIALDPKSHRIYLPTAEFQPIQKGKRPKVMEGTQKVLVYGPE